MRVPVRPSDFVPKRKVLPVVVIEVQMVVRVMSSTVHDAFEYVRYVVVLIMYRNRPCGDTRKSV